jgi:hypothetical protein
MTSLDLKLKLVAHRLAFSKSDYDVSSSQVDVESSKDNANSSVGDFYNGN